MRTIIAVAFLAVLAGCGGYQQRASGIDAQTLLIIRSPALVGTTVKVDPSFERTVIKEDLTPYDFGILGARDKPEEGMETLTVKVTPGNRKVTVLRGGAVVVEREMYFAQGQTRELEIK